MTEADVPTGATQDEPRRRTRMAFPVAVVLLAVSAVALFTLQPFGGDTTPDRLEFVAALNLPDSGVASLGTMELDNPTRATMQVERVRLLHAEGVRLMGATVISPNDRAAYGFYDAGPEFPPAEWPYPSVRTLDERIPVEEFSRAPEEAPLTLKVMIGVEATRPGMVGFNGVEVTYKVGGRRRTHQFAHGLVMCAPPSRCDMVDPAAAMVELGLLREG